MKIFPSLASADQLKLREEIEKLKNHTRSSTPTFKRLEPDAAICVDISPACDTPELEGKYDMALGNSYT